MTCPHCELQFNFNGMAFVALGVQNLELKVGDFLLCDGCGAISCVVPDNGVVEVELSQIENAALQKIMQAAQHVVRRKTVVALLERMGRAVDAARAGN